MRNGVDTSGVFGLLGRDLTGLSYTARYLLDTGVGAVATDNGVVGRLDGELATSPLKAWLTIGSVSFAFGDRPLTYSTATQVNGSFDETNHFVKDFSNGQYFNYIFNDVSSTPDMLDTSDYTRALDYRVRSGDRGNSAFAVGDNIGNQAGGGLNVDRVTIAGLASVPEPATWAMMTGGLGIVGGAMRRRKGRTTASFA